MMTANNLITGKPILKISFYCKKIQHLNNLRDYIENFLILNDVDERCIGRSIITVSELLENAIKYSVSDKIDLTIQKDLIHHELNFTVSNKTNKNNAVKAEKCIKEINNFIDPMLLLLKKMRKNDNNYKDLHGLGLSRISAESEAKIKIKYHKKKSVLDIQAKLKLD